MPTVTPSPVTYANPAFWIVLVIALLVLSFLLMYWDRFYAEITSSFGSLRLGGEKKRNVAITAKQVTTTEGGLTAVDGTGKGIDAIKINTKDHINLKVVDDRKDSSSIDAQKLTAGKDITIQQFIQNFEVSKSNNLNSHQFDQYFELWKSLQELHSISHELWDLNDEVNLVQFATQLKKTRKLVHQQHILFKDSDRQKLFAVLQAFGEIKVGTRMLREIRSEADIHNFLNEVIITSNSVPQREVIKQIVNDNEDYKLDYEEVVERIRISFRESLSGKKYLI